MFKKHCLVIKLEFIPDLFDLKRNNYYSGLIDGNNSDYSSTTNLIKLNSE